MKNRLILALLAFGAINLWFFHLKKPADEEPAEVKQMKLVTGLKPLVDIEKAVGAAAMATPGGVSKSATGKRPPRSREEILKLIEDDKICDVFLEAHAGHMQDFDALDAVLAARPVSGLSAEEDRELTKAFGSSGTFQGVLDPSDVSPAIRFFNALYLSGQMHISGSPKVQTYDYGIAYSLMSGLAQSDPSNGAFPFFLSTIMDKRGESADAIQKVLLQAAAAPQFDTFITRFSRNIIKKGLSNAALFIQTFGITAAMPIPDYGPTQKIIRDQLAVSGNDFAQAILNISQLMMAPGSANYQKPEFYYWLMIEYAVGHGLYDSAWKKLNGDQTLPDDIIPTKTIFKRNKDLDREDSALVALEDWADTKTKAGVDLSVEHTDCPRAPLDHFLERQRKVFESEPN